MLISQCCMALMDMTANTCPCPQGRLGQPSLPVRNGTVSVTHICTPWALTLTHMMLQTSSVSQVTWTGHMSSRYKGSSMTMEGKRLGARGSAAGIEEAAAAIGGQC